MPSAPEIRIDQLTGLRTILAPGRAARPDSFAARASEPKGPESCPFCEGREDRTPPELYATRPGDGGPETPGWTTRVVPNLYPALGQPSSDTGDNSVHGSVAPAADAGSTNTASLRASNR